MGIFLFLIHSSKYLSNDITFLGLGGVSEITTFFGLGLGGVLGGGPKITENLFLVLILGLGGDSEITTFFGLGFVFLYQYLVLRFL